MYGVFFCEHSVMVVVVVQTIFSVDFHSTFELRDGRESLEFVTFPIFPIN